MSWVESWEDNNAEIPTLCKCSKITRTTDVCQAVARIRQAIPSGTIRVAAAASYCTGSTELGTCLELPVLLW